MTILRESGIQRLTQVAVSDEAGVRQSHLTYYFPTRHDLLEAVTARAVDGIASGVRETVQARGAAGLDAVLARLARVIADLEHMRMFIAVVVEADGDPAVRSLVVRATRQLEGALAEALGGEDAADRARLVLAAIWGFGLYQFVTRSSPRSGPARRYLTWVAESARVKRRRRRREG